jgi:chromosome segregation ATPase
MSDPSPRRDDAFALLDAVIEMQKRSVGSMDRLATRVHELTVETVRVARSLTQLQAGQSEIKHDVNTFRVDVTARFDALLNWIDARFEAIGERFKAVGARFEDIERTLDRIATELHDARTEIVSQNNQTLNAIQSALQVKTQLDDLVERIEQLERKE